MLKRFLGYFLALAAVGGATLTAVLWENQRLALRSVTQHQEARLRLNEEIIGFSLKRFATDALMLAELTRNLGADTGPPLSAVEALYLGFSRARGDYLQVRLLSADGMELVRVNAEANGWRVVPAKELQSKRDRPYFRECSPLPVGVVGFSGPELNRERGVVELPRRPVLRVCTPLGEAGAARFVILNFPAAPFLDRLRSRDADSADVVWLTDGRGSWARGPRDELEWGADFGFTPGTSVAEWENGALGQALSLPTALQRLADGSQVVTRLVDPAAAVRIPAAGVKVAAAPSKTWLLVSYASADRIFGATRRVQLIAFLLFIGFLTLSAALATKLARAAHQRNLAQREIAEQEARLRDFLDSASDLVLSVDAQGRFVYVNRAWEAALGWSGAEAQTLRFQDVVAPESREHCHQIVAQLQAGSSVADVDARFVSRSGETIDVLGRLSLRREGELVFTRGYFRDVTAEKEALRQLVASEERFRHIVEEGLGLLCRHDLNGVLLEVNPAAATALGFDDRTVLEGRSLADIIEPEYRDSVPPYLSLIASQRVAEGDFHIRTRTGDSRIWRFRNVLVVHPTTPPYVLGTALDITELRAAERRSAEESRRDSLTGLHNRRSFEDHLAVAIATDQRHRLRGDSRYLGLMVGMLDLDGFKPVNDRLGHATGDALLREVAAALQGCLRGTDVVARLGGDEFALLLPESGDPSTFQSLAEKLLEAVSSAAARVAQEAEVTASLGLANSVAGQDGPALMAAADTALYAAKAAGRGTWRLASASV